MTKPVPERSKKRDLSRASKPNGTAANLGFEAKLWAAADALRNNMDAADVFSFS